MTYTEAVETSAQDEIDFREGFPEEEGGIFVPEADDFEDAEAEWDDFDGFPTFDDFDGEEADEAASRWENSFYND